MPKGRIKGTYKHSEESKRKIGQSQKGRKRPDFSEWLKHSNPNKGKFGKEHPCYKEVKKHKFYKQIRETFKYRQWRSDVFTRDNFTCTQCNARGYLEADHIKRFIDIIREYDVKSPDEALNCEELWNINNGRTLCVNCHRETDTWGRKVKVRKMQ